MSKEVTDKECCDCCYCRCSYVGNKILKEIEDLKFNLKLESERIQGAQHKQFREIITKIDPLMSGIPTPPKKEFK